MTFTFSEATSDFTLADTTAVGGALSHLATTDGGLTYTATFTANADTDISNGSVSVTADTWHEANGNPGTGATSTAFVVDTVTPTAAVTVGSSDVNLAAHTALVTFTFSEATSDFTLADTTAVGGALSHLATTDGGLTYTATFTANANTDISNGSVSVTAGTWHEANGNPGTGATSTAFVVDTVTPTRDGDDQQHRRQPRPRHRDDQLRLQRGAEISLSLADTTATGGALSNLRQGRQHPLHRDLHGQRQHRHQQWLGERHRRQLEREQRQPRRRRQHEPLRGRHRDAKGGVCV